MRSGNEDWHARKVAADAALARTVARMESQREQAVGERRKERRKNKALRREYLATMRRAKQLYQRITT